VAGEGKDLEDGGPKGFAGISSLLSDVDKLQNDSHKENSAGAKGLVAEAEESEGRRARSDLVNRRRPAEENQESAGDDRRRTQAAQSEQASQSPFWRWSLGIIAVIGIVWFLVASQKPTSSMPTNKPSTQSSFPRAQTPSRPEEAKPLAGINLVFSTAEITYCLAEDIRIDGANFVLNTRSDSEVNQFNAMVSDYNSRCGSFRYKKGALERARSAIEPYRGQLRTQGESRLARSAPSVANPRPIVIDLDSPRSNDARKATSPPVPDATVKSIQRILNELGYEAGNADGLMGNATRTAIIAFQRDAGLVSDGLSSVPLLRKLERGAIKSDEAAKVSTRLAESPINNGHRLPENSSLNYLGNGWDCNRGYSRVGNECRSVQIPQNGSLNYVGNGWDCNRGYSRVGNECRSVQIPQNGSLNYLGNGWDCNHGYSRAGNECRSVQIPQNGSLNYVGNGWDCNHGYSRVGNECRSVQIPQNGSLNYLGNGWDCNRGYSRVGNECRSVQVPQNGSLNYLGNGWDCSRGFRRVGQKCESL
jgi:hypothetical protein